MDYKESKKGDSQNMTDLLKNMLKTDLLTKQMKSYINYLKGTESITLMFCY